VHRQQELDVAQLDSVSKSLNFCRDFGCFVETQLSMAVGGGEQRVEGFTLLGLMAAADCDGLESMSSSSSCERCIDSRPHVLQGYCPLYSSSSERCIDSRLHVVLPAAGVETV
jgi:hypothetical protein